MSGPAVPGPFRNVKQSRGAREFGSKRHANGPSAFQVPIVTEFAFRVYIQVFGCLCLELAQREDLSSRKFFNIHDSKLVIDLIIQHHNARV